MHMTLPRLYRLLAFMVIVMGLLSGCAQKRNALPVSLHGKASINGLGQIRTFGDAPSDRMQSEMIKWSTQIENSPYASAPLTMLSLSGGGSDGAFGAGLLTGWSARGDRPVFTMVTGVSTGALIAPFAFLGTEYDRLLKLFYTTFSTEDLVTERAIGSAISSNAFYSTDPLHRTLKTYISSDVIARIAEEYRKGRRLFIGTTNLDAMRPVYWDITAIAQHRSEKNDQLIRDIIQASVSIPVAFPPVYFTVQAEGKEYDEMHVDGGVTNQVFAYPVSFQLKDELEKIGNTRQLSLYVIRNGLIASKGKPVEPNLGDIAEKSMTSLIHNQGIGDLYRIYYTAMRDGVDFHLAFIPSSFQHEAEDEEMFDTKYMKKLFRLGYDMAFNNTPWHKAPPTDLSRQPASQRN